MKKFEKVYVTLLTRAGTGKTLLATDFVRRKVTLGERVLYLTSNKNLSNNINNQMEGQENRKIINIHALFDEYVTVDVKKMQQNPQKYFGDELPEVFFNWINDLTKDNAKVIKSRSRILRFIENLVILEIQGFS